MTDVNVLAQTKNWMERAIPEPVRKNQTTQMGVHFEEVAEMLDVVDSNDYETISAILTAKAALKRLSQLAKERGDLVVTDPKEFLDALCDQIVTATGCAHNYNMDIVGALNEVNRSNFSKFDEDGQPIFDANRKIIKGPNYSKADLDPFLITKS